MESEAIQNRQEMYEIKKALALGYISYDEAYTEAMPILNRINRRGRELARKYHRDYKPISFSEIIR